MVLVLVFLVCVGVSVVVDEFFFFSLFRGRGWEGGEKNEISSLSLSLLSFLLFTTSFPPRIKKNQQTTHVGKLGQAVGRGRRHHADVGPPPELDVQNRVADAPPGPPLVLVAADGPRLWGQVRLGEEAAGRVGGDDSDVAELGEEAGEL